MDEDEVMEFGLFQLENLFLNPNKFKFFDLRESILAVRPEVDQILKKAEIIKASDVHPFLREHKIPYEFPVVLVCEDGAQSKKTAHDLSGEGFQNIYVVAGGVDGLLLEF